MAKLTFTGRSGDGKRLLLVDESGQQHSVVIDAKLRNALSGVSASNGQLEIPMESTLRPRDIQARIRAGETPEAVAHAAGTSVEKIMAFAAPVLAERAHVAERAQLASVRRRANESGARTLGEAVTAHLRSHNVDPGSVEWEAWRREDGRWTLTGMYDVAGRTGIATFSHDPRGNFVTVDDEDARWLIGEAATATSPEPAADDLAAARQRRLSAVSGEELPLGEDAIEMVTGEEPTGEADPANETTAELSALGAEQSVEAYLDGTTDERPAEPEPATEPEPEASPQAADEPTAEPKARPRKRGRASVPSWDEIMFGGGKGD
ncbi:septation protein SepH [Microbacterium sp. ARD31]|uniref:septation protein SepH n=1 Tax=Microbacterium sp. ARD31 TaxID=2962576 RepID=UPI0028813B02|nr:septation protein SepH [Microbacterium sp. ARD31]MDT0187207.1 septation protein SepH [Microbacterium sp. ARD31]